MCPASLQIKFSHEKFENPTNLRAPTFENTRDVTVMWWVNQRKLPTPGARNLGIFCSRKRHEKWRQRTGTSMIWDAKHAVWSSHVCVGKKRSFTLAKRQNAGAAWTRNHSCFWTEEEQDAHPPITKVSVSQNSLDPSEIIPPFYVWRVRLPKRLDGFTVILTNRQAFRKIGLYQYRMQSNRFFVCLFVLYEHRKREKRKKKGEEKGYFMPKAISKRGTQVEM